MENQECMHGWSPEGERSELEMCISIKNWVRNSKFEPFGFRIQKKSVFLDIQNSVTT